MSTLRNFIIRGEYYSFLQSISKNTIKAYHYMGYKELSHLDEESSAVNIVKEINRLVSNE